jgi:putative DNA primase/helicase
MRFIDYPKADNERKRDPSLKQKLQSEAPGILAWLVAGAMSWYQAGRLSAPEKVRLATSAYKAEMDPLTDFLEEFCVLKSGAQVGNTALWEAYLKWADKSRMSKPLGRKDFSQRIAAIDCVEQKRTGRERIWHGIGLIAEGHDH